MADYRNALQYGDQVVQWDPTQQIWSGAPETMPGYVPMLLQTRDRVRSGQATPGELEQYQQWEAQARAMPTRDLASLTAGWQGDLQGQWTESGWQAGNADWWTSLDPSSPDVGGIMLQLADRLDAGTATAQERALYGQVLGMANDWNWRASVPQPSDVGFGLGDNLTGALLTLGLGATGGLAAAPLAAGGASLATTLGSLGTLSGIAGTGAGVLGQAMDQDWLRTAGLALGAAGGVLGGAGGLANLWTSGVQSLGDAAKLAQSAGRITGAVGRASGNEALGQASRYLGLAGQAGSVGSGVLPTSVTDWTTQRGGPMAWDDWASTDWLNWSGGGQGPLLSDAAPGIDWSSFTTGGPGSWAGQVMTDWANGPLDTGGGGGGGGGLLSTLGGLGKFLGSTASWLGPAASALGSLGAGAIGGGASRDAAAAQAAALNRGLDLQTAQWLQQQANQAPWLEAGRSVLPHLQQIAGQGMVPTFQPGAPVSGANYALPSATPGWTPQTYAGYTPTDVPSAAGYQYTPGQVPSAAGYRYTPGQIPAASQYRYTPGAVPTLSGQELLANDPGYQFRQDEARRALEASAAARGGLTSGATLSALQRQSQDLASQEYGQAWNRAAQQAQMREQWGQAASQLGFGQAMDETRLREQAAQIASQQGWSQAQAETALREQLQQQATSQNWSQALAEAQSRAQQAQFGWQAGMSAQQAGQQEARQYETDLYNRLFQQNQLQYGRDWAENQALYERGQQGWQNTMKARELEWNQLAALAGYGQTSVGQLGTQGQAATSGLTSLLDKLGQAQGLGDLGSALSWQRGLSGATNNLTSLLASLNR